MTDPTIVDVHMHIYQTKQQGRRLKEEYPILEYGEKSDVRFSELAGSMDDALTAMRATGVSLALVLNVFTTSEGVAGLVEEAPGAPDGSKVQHDTASVRASLIAYNAWVCSLARNHPELLPVISVDPWALPTAEIERHVREMVTEHGARGVKVHPIAQRFHAADERMLGSYRACAELAVPVVAHCGLDPKSPTGTEQRAHPHAFGHLLQDVPDLLLVLAHLGGGAWRDTESLALDFPSVCFDCSEIIAWTGGSSAPTDRELALLIRRIGSDRVMLGSDFPWYDLEHVVNRIQDLPLLGEEEKEGLLGLNALRILGIDWT